MDSPEVDSLVSHRRAMRRATLLALYDASDESPGPRVTVRVIAQRASADAEQVLSQLLILESLELANDVDRTGAALTGHGAVLAERLLCGDDVSAGAL